jgi:hypothetical protein
MAVAPPQAKDSKTGGEFKENKSRLAAGLARRCPEKKFNHGGHGDHGEI